MTARCLVLLIALYVSVDLADPWMPGAFVFDPAKSVDALSTRRDGAGAPDDRGPASDLTLTGGPQPVKGRALQRISPARPQSQWGGGPRRAHVPSTDLAPPGDEH